MSPGMPKSKVLYLLPLLAAILAVLGPAVVPVSGATPSPATIRAESWTGSPTGSGVTRSETYSGVYRTRTYMSPAHLTSFSFNAVASTWEASLPRDSSIRIWFRASADGQAWSQWTAVASDDDGGMRSGRNYGNLQVISGTQAQYRVDLVAPTARPMPSVSSVSFTFINSKDGPGPGDLSASTPGVAYAAEAAPRIISRAQWGAQEGLRFDDAGREIWPHEYTTPTKAIIHETVTLNNDPNPPATVRAIYYYHAVVRGWGDIGYNYLVDAGGNIYEGRHGGENVVGGHARCFNWGTIGIAALGEYNSGRPTAALLQSIENLLAWKLDKYNINPKGRGVLGSYAPKDIGNVATHADLFGTCGNTHADPGILLRRELPAMIDRLARRLGSSRADAPPAPMPPPPPPTAPAPAPPAPPTPPVESEEATTEETPANTVGEPRYKVDTGYGYGVNMREKPDNKSKVLLVVPECAEIQEQTSPVDGWVWTTYRKKAGYIWYENLSEVPNSRKPKPSAPAGPQDKLAPGASATIDGTPGALNLRSGPGMEHKVVAKVWEGMGLRVTGKPQKGWYPVVYTDLAGNEQKGWTWGEYLKPGGSEAASTVGAASLVGAMALPAWRWRRRKRKPAA